jgi:hypothetical protein
MKKVYLKEYLSVDLAASINLVLFATKFLNSLQVMEKLTLLHISALTIFTLKRFLCYIKEFVLINKL